MKLKDLGEHNFISDIISKYLGKDVNSDVFIQGNKVYKLDGFQLSYTLPFMDYYDIGWKAVTGTISDIIFSLASPNIVMVSLGLSNDMEVNDAEKIIKGIYDASIYYHARYVGGDTNNSSSSGWIDVAGIGDLLCNEHPQIDKGDVIVVTNKIGFTSNFFISYLSNFKIPIFHDSLVKISHPVVNTHLPRVLQRFCGAISYSTDISDGLVITLYNIIQRFSVGIKLDRIPINDVIANMLKTYGYSIFDILKFSGEEYEGIFVVKEKNYEEFVNALSIIGYSPMEIGRVDGSNSLIYNDKKLNETGWDNFKGWF
ncbi:thiamine-phosphate kinase [Acidianus brierleyi]|uniref:Thiamine-monophosphate kinase n=1 Tax=Acidianus brierleyi TaxID=41673 RepID=A0A2U9IEM1_9CREN|nr:AIR synthase related protein [Acidianus brierleyi]AWR94488.1 thiamine-monophosphate kinase [Acidianus brierleyi]